MPDIPISTHATVDLGPRKYQSSLRTFRGMLEATDARIPFLRVGLQTPKAETLELQVRHDDAYVIGFKGADDWYALDGEKGAWGKPCGTGGNYNNLGFVGRVVYDDLVNVGALGQFQKGAPLDKRLLAIAIALTSEAVRFSTVATWFTGLTNSVGTDHSPYLQYAISRQGGVDFEHLKRNYFTRWDKPRPEMEVGKVYHFGAGEVLLPRKR